MRLSLCLTSLALLVSFAACGGAETSGNTTDTTTSTGSGSGGAGGTGGSAPAVDRGPTTLVVDGDPNGLFWDDTTATLFIADSDNNRILQWTDASGLGKFADLPAGPANGPGLGQLVKMGDGTLVVVRFGFGTAGDVVFVKADGSSGKVPGLDVQRRRIGLTVTPDDALYDTYFVKAAGVDLGSVAKLDLAGTETEVTTGLDKPIGVLASGDSLLVTDQGAGTLLKVPLSSPDMTAVLAYVDEPDLLCTGPDGSVFTGGGSGDIRQISADGKVSSFAGGFSSVRGVAYDAKNKRLFASDHDLGGTTNKLQILPVP